MENLNIIFDLVCYTAIFILIIFCFYLNNKNNQLVEKNAKQEEAIYHFKTELKELEIVNTNIIGSKQFNEETISILKQIIVLFINQSSSLIVYSNSNFYKNFNFHNKRYYAKINSKPTNNKAEAIPFLQINGKTNVVLDLYKLKYIFNTETLLSNNNLLNVIKDCYINKEQVITELGNKVLKSYKG